MSHSQTKPLSELLRSGDDSEPKKQSREEWRQAKELEEARKLGNAPAAVDETGKDINPHIPQYISTVPWYVGSSGPTLKHQRPQSEREKTFSSIHEGYHRGTFLSTQATKYRKGSCENCGAMGHGKKNCMERPRKLGARFTNEDIAPDEIEQPDLNLDFDGKRDRWNGYDPSHYQEVVEEYRRVEEAKRQLKEQKLKEETGESGTGAGGKSSGHPDDSDDEDKYADKIDMPGTKVDSKQRITVRNLRIREDTAKYLRNLDPDSAHYDPKTRSMRDNPYKNTGKTPDEVSFAGENFVRYSGDTKQMLQDQAFAWEAHNSGVDIHLLAEPTKAALLTKEFHEKKQQVEGSIKNAILDRYGGEEHLKAPPKELLYAQTENYVEYSRTGQILRGAERIIVRSKYEEDVFTNNHTTVWGSYWESFKWGYKCCHSFVKNSYCTGVAGKMVREDAGSALKYGSKKSKANDEDNDEAPGRSQDGECDRLSQDDSQGELSEAKRITSKTVGTASDLPLTAIGNAATDTNDKAMSLGETSGRQTQEPGLSEPSASTTVSLESPLKNTSAGVEDAKANKYNCKKDKKKKKSRTSKKKKSKKQHNGSEGDGASDSESGANPENSDESGSSSSDSSSDDDDEEDPEKEKVRRKQNEIRRAKKREKKRNNKKHKRDKEKKLKAEEKKLAQAMKRYEQEQRQEVDERKRTYNSMYEHKAPTEEDIEAYFLKRHRPEDPMAHFMENSGR